MKQHYCYTKFLFTITFMLFVGTPIQAQENPGIIKSKDSINARLDSISAGIHFLKPRKFKFESRIQVTESYDYSNYSDPEFLEYVVEKDILQHLSAYDTRVIDSLYRDFLKQKQYEEQKKTESPSYPQKRSKTVPTAFGGGWFIGATYFFYDGDMQRHFKHTYTFSMDFDLMYYEFMLTAKTSWGGGRTYDTLNVKSSDWMPLSRISTTNYGLFLGYAIRDNSWLKVTPFVGVQNMKIKHKPRYMPLVPDNLIKATDVYSLGAHVEFKSHTSSTAYIGVGGRLTYSFSFVNFSDVSGYMHQLSLNFGLNMRDTKTFEVPD